MTQFNRRLIEVKGLRHTYLQGTPLQVVSLRGVDLEVAPGEIVGIVGPTGSGKSTLLQHLNGLLRPQEGEVFVCGLSVGDPSTNIRGIRQRVGLVFQNPEDQLFERYAGDDVAFGPHNLGLPSDEVRSRVRKAMHDVGLPFEYKDRMTEELSQGERRRLGLAGVLALEPQILVLDEPTAGLDPQGRRALLRILSEWASGAGRAIVLATHNMEDIAELADAVYVLVDGRVALRGSPRELFSSPESLLKLGLTVPLATQAMIRLRERGYAVRTSVLNEEEALSEIEALLDVQRI